MDIKGLWIKVSSKWRVLLVIFAPAMILYALVAMLPTTSIIVNSGRADLSGIDFSHNKSVALGGLWEFYWDKLLMPEAFNSGERPQMDSFMKVPGVWSHNSGTHYDRQGIATYRLFLYYPLTLKDPALRIQSVANAYKLYVNGQWT